MMEHASEVVAISLADRIGGAEGYRLMQSCVKKTPRALTHIESTSS